MTSGGGMAGDDELERLRERVEDGVDQPSSWPAGRGATSGVLTRSRTAAGAWPSAAYARTRGAELGHDGGGLDAAPDHVADGHGDAAAAAAEKRSYQSPPRPAPAAGR